MQTALNLQTDYYSPESNLRYMSNSQYKDFLTCEAMAIAKMVGEWNPPPTIERMVGSYVHAWNEGEEALKQFKASTPEMFNKNGTMKAQFLFADQMIETLENDELCMAYLEGQKEVIMTAEMFGCEWKIKIDTYRPDAIVDLKTTRSIWDMQWSSHYNTKVSFIETYDYFQQFAIYLEVERITTGRDKWLTPYIVAVSKEQPPDKAIIRLQDDERIASELLRIEGNMPHILAVKHGDIKPVRCGKCAYCRATSRVDRIISYRELEGGE